MTLEECKKLKPGDLLQAGDAFVEGEDPDVEPWFGKVITFDHLHNNKWLYFKEKPGAPFHIGEIICKVNVESIDDENVPYDIGDMSLIFGGASYES